MLRTAAVRKIIEELNEKQKFQMPRNRKDRKNLLQETWITECGEVYSPPRVTQIVSELGLRPAWSLDLTTIDAEDGKPWDFSDPAKRKKASELIKRDKPLLLVVCPMCGAFSSMNNWNYEKMKSEDAREKLERAMEHVKFALDLCMQQYKAGRLFMFEHPTSASSWTTTMMQQMMNLEGVYVSKFDFCQLGMETKGEAPVIPCNDMRRPSVPAKKRTTVLTNSANLAEVLRRAQCQGLHRHQHLINGRAKKCKIYPRKFIELIGDCIQKEIEDAKWRNKIAEKMVGISRLGEAERSVSGIAAMLPQAASPVGIPISYL